LTAGIFSDTYEKNGGNVMRCIFCSDTCTHGDLIKFEGASIYHLKCNSCAEYYIDELSYHVLTRDDYHELDHAISRDDLIKKGRENKKHFDKKGGKYLYLLECSPGVC
jgi:hypothetical protein